MIGYLLDKTNILLPKKQVMGSLSEYSYFEHCRVPSVSEEPRPPYSDVTTSVWYWILDGQATTVMFNKNKKEVWCNGFLLTTYVRTTVTQYDTIQLSVKQDNTMLWEAVHAQ